MAENAQSVAFELVDPPFPDLEQRNRLEVVDLLPAVPGGADQVRCLQDGEVLERRRRAVDNELQSSPSVCPRT